MEDVKTNSTPNNPISYPRPFTQRERGIIELYCQLDMTPRQFYTKWQVNQQLIASICCRSVATVGCWFARGKRYRRPRPSDLRLLAIADVLLEHFEKIPEDVRNLLCSRDR